MRIKICLDGEDEKSSGNRWGLWLYNNVGTFLSVNAHLKRVKMIGFMLCVFSTIKNVP